MPITTAYVDEFRVDDFEDSMGDAPLACASSLLTIPIDKTNKNNCLIPINISLLTSDEFLSI